MARTSFVLNKYLLIIWVFGLIRPDISINLLPVHVAITM